MAENLTMISLIGSHLCHLLKQIWKNKGKKDSSINSFQVGCFSSFCCTEEGPPSKEIRKSIPERKPLEGDPKRSVQGCLFLFLLLLLASLSRQEQFS